MRWRRGRGPREGRCRMTSSISCAAALSGRSRPVHEIELPRHTHLPDPQLAQIAARHFPLHAHSRHDGHALLHFHEKLDALDRRQLHVHPQRHAVTRKHLHHALPVGRFHDMRDERFLPRSVMSTSRRFASR